MGLLDLLKQSQTGYAPVFNQPKFSSAYQDVANPSLFAQKVPKGVPTRATATDLGLNPPEWEDKNPRSAMALEILSKGLSGGNFEKIIAGMQSNPYLAQGYLDQAKEVQGRVAAQAPFRLEEMKQGQETARAKSAQSNEMRKALMMAEIEKPYREAGLEKTKQETLVIPRNLAIAEERIAIDKKANEMADYFKQLGLKVDRDKIATEIEKFNAEQKQKAEQAGKWNILGIHGTVNPSLIGEAGQAANELKKRG